MLGKAKSVSYTAASVDYARKLNLEDDKKGIIIDTNMIVGNTGQEVFKEFQIFQDLNSRCENNTISIVISPFPEDSKKLTNEQWAELSQEVLKRMGLQDHQSITLKHPHDTHDHLHGYVNRIDLNGIAYKDNFISKKIQTVCDEVAIDFNFTRAKEVEIANKIVNEPTHNKIKEIYTEVLQEQNTNSKNIFWKLENKGLQVAFNKSNTGYNVRLNGLEFSASQIDKAYSLPNLNKTIADSKLHKDFTKLTTKEQIQIIFSKTLTEPGTSTQNFLDKVAKKGVEVIPIINKQGDIQGHKVAYKGEEFKISEIGNKYTLHKLPATIEKEGFNKTQTNSSESKSTATRLHEILSNVLVERSTTKENFSLQLESKGIKYTPLKNDKGEVNNFKLEFNSKSFLATDVLLKYTLQNPEKLIDRTREIQQYEHKGIERMQIRGEISQLYHQALKMNFPDQKTFFSDLKSDGMEFKSIDKNDYLINYKNHQFTASEINRSYTLDKLDQLRVSFNSKSIHATNPDLSNFNKLINFPENNPNNQFRDLADLGIPDSLNHSMPHEKQKAEFYLNQKGTIDQNYIRGEKLQLSPIEKIRNVFTETLSEKNLTPSLFLQRVTEKGVVIHPSVNSQGKFQGYRVSMDGANFKASEIGNKYTLAKLENTIKVEGGKSIFPSQIKSEFKNPSVQERITHIISNALNDRYTTPENFYQKIAIKGVKTTPIANPKGEITNYAIEFNNRKFLATELNLKHVFDSPEKFITKDQNFHPYIQNGPNRELIKNELNQIFQQTLKMDLPNQTVFYNELKSLGIEFKQVNNSDYKIDYKNYLFSASEINQGYTLDRLDSLIGSFANNANNNEVTSQFNYDLNLDSHHNVSNERSSTNADFSQNDFNNDANSLLGSFFIPMGRSFSSNYEEETEEEKLKKKRKRNNNNNNNLAR